MGVRVTVTLALLQKHKLQDRVNHIETVTVASDDGGGWNVADRTPMQALHMSRTKTRNRCRCIAAN